MSICDDTTLIRQLLGGDKSALRVFYRIYYPKLVNYMLTKVRNGADAEELAQDTLLGFLDALPLFKRQSSLWTFMISIAKHEVADYYRKLYAKRAIKYVPFIDQIYNEPFYSGEETAELFYQALARLRPSERKLLMWKYDQKLSVKEIATQLGVGVKAAESKLFRARKAFVLAYNQVVPSE